MTAISLGARTLVDEEADELAHMARSRMLEAGQVRRVQIVRHAVDGLGAPEVAARMRLCGSTVQSWLRRFNARGFAGLEGDMRSRRPATYSAEERTGVIAAALSRPSELGLPFASWALDRLIACLGEQSIGVRRSRISEVLLADGMSNVIVITDADA